MPLTNMFKIHAISLKYIGTIELHMIVKKQWIMT